MTALRIVFMGSPDFAIPTLKSIHANHTVAAVVTQPDRPAGRGRQPKASDVKRYASANGIAVLEPARASSKATETALKEINPDMIVVAAYGQILRQNILELPRFGCLNVHASLLPRWRGASPIQAAILHNDDETGVTIMKMNEGLDTGPILAQKSIPLSDTITGGELFSTLSMLGAKLLIPTIEDYTAGRIKPQPQNDDISTYAPMLKKTDGELDFRKPARHLAAQVRAYEPWPGSYFFFNGRRIVVHAARSVPETSGKHGAAFSIGNLPAITCENGSIVLESVQPAGKNTMGGDAFLNGARKFPGTNLIETSSG